MKDRHNMKGQKRHIQNHKKIDCNTQFARLKSAYKLYLIWLRLDISLFGVQTKTIVSVEKKHTQRAYAIEVQHRSSVTEQQNISTNTHTHTHTDNGTFLIQLIFSFRWLNVPLRTLSHTHTNANYLNMRKTLFHFPSPFHSFLFIFHYNFLVPSTIPFRLVVIFFFSTLYGKLCRVLFVSAIRFCWQHAIEKHI